MVEVGDSFGTAVVDRAGETREPVDLVVRVDAQLGRQFSQARIEKEWFWRDRADVVGPPTVELQVSIRDATVPVAVPGLDRRHDELVSEFLIAYEHDDLVSGFDSTIVRGINIVLPVQF
jgi:hypothetical protein